MLQQLDSHYSDAESERILENDTGSDAEPHSSGAWNASRTDDAGKGHGNEKLGLKATAKLSFHFCLLWVSILRIDFSSCILANVKLVYCEWSRYRREVQLENVLINAVGELFLNGLSAIHDCWKHNYLDVHQWYGILEEFKAQNR